MNINIKLLSVIIIFVCGNHSFPQKISGASFKKFGLLTGMNLSNMNFNQGFPRPSVPVDASWKSEIITGLWVRIPLAKKFSLQPEYCYTRRRGADKSIGINYLLEYFSLPVLLNYKISSRVALVTGLQPELLIRAKAYNNRVDSTITHDTEERSIGVTAGFDVQLNKTFALSARYLKGLNHIGIGQRSNVKEFKYEALNLSLEIGFGKSCKN